MAKKRSFVPGILFTMPTPQPTTVVGGGTGQSTTDPFACDYDTWLNLFAGDYNNDGETNGADYEQWFHIHFEDEFEELWAIFGPTAPSNPNPAPIILPDPVIDPTIIPTVEPSIEP